MAALAVQKLGACAAKHAAEHPQAVSTSSRSSVFTGQSVPLSPAMRHVAGRQRAAARAMVAVAPPAQQSEGSMSQIKKWAGNKRLQTQTSEIAKDICTIRSLDWDRDRFDIEFGLQNGTTYNSYIIRGDKLALVDASHEKFRDLYLAALKNEIDPSKIEYIVVNHTEPDHSGLIPDLLAMAPEATVVGSKVCIQFLENLVLKPFKSQIVKGGDTLDLGKGHKLEFVIAPNLHWPDTMFSFDHGSGIIFTCDAFGMHYCSEHVFDQELTAVEPHFRFYYDCLMRPNARSVLTALRKVKDLEFNTIAVGHGPLLRNNVAELVEKYSTWSTKAVEKQQASALVLYTSDYGFSDRLSQAFARGITKTEVGVEMLCMSSAETQELVEAVNRNAAVVIMAPPHTGPANKALGTLLSAVNPKQKVVVAESYGGDDEPVDTMVGQFVGVGVQPAFAPLRVKDTPTEATYQMYEEEGTDLGQLLTKKAKAADLKAGMSNDVAKAIARVAGGLYVVTAKKGSSSGAMIASWVSQASFKPLGITIAVAKDRAIESLMQVGDTFVLNCLEEGNFSALMKHFLKRFPPGADRFEGVETTPASNGSPIIKDAVAYIECKVVSRMETADHWITYAEVSDGNISKTEARTATHFRKVGNYY